MDGFNNGDETGLRRCFVDAYGVHRCERLPKCRLTQDSDLTEMGSRMNAQYSISQYPLIQSLCRRVHICLFFLGDEMVCLHPSSDGKKQEIIVRFPVVARVGHDDSIFTQAHSQLLDRPASPSKTSLYSVSIQARKGRTAFDLVARQDLRVLRFDWCWLDYRRWDSIGFRNEEVEGAKEGRRKMSFEKEARRRRYSFTNG